MVEFLQSYGIFILLGLIVALVLFRRQGHGMGGCCGGGHEPDREKDKAITTEIKSGSHSSGGCH